MRFESKITAKGRTTMPVEVRKVFGAAPGDIVVAQIDLEPGCTHTFTFDRAAARPDPGMELPA